MDTNEHRLGSKENPHPAFKTGRKITPVKEDRIKGDYYLVDDELLCWIGYGFRNRDKEAQRVKKYTQANKKKVSERRKKHYEKNKEKLSERRKKHYENNKEKHAERAKKYREANKEKIAERLKVYATENKEKIANYKKQWRENNKERLAKNKKEYRKNNREILAKKEKEWYEKNKERVAQRGKEYREKNKEKCRERSKKYRENNREILLKKKREYYQKNKEKIKKKSKEWDKNNRERRNKRERDKRKSDPATRILHNLRTRLLSALKRDNASKNKRTLEYFNCSVEDFYNYIEQLFTDGMNWNNQGKKANDGKGWELDHRRPCASFDLNDEEQIHMCFHYTNYQPLWSKDNNSKSNKFNPEKFPYEWKGRDIGWVGIYNFGK
jgi:hypothetical protein